MIRHALSVALLASLLGACASPGSVTTTTEPADDRTGKRFWIGSILDEDFCPQPGMEFRAKDCAQLHEGAEFTVEARQTIRYRTFYRVTLKDGRTGYINDTALALARNEAAQAEMMAAQAAAGKRRAAAKAECDRRGGVRIGMTAEQVRASCWGKPRYVNRTTTARGTSEQWVYGGGNYVYLDNGIVTTVQH